MQIRLFQVGNGECPYLKNREWHTYCFEASKMESLLYEQLMNNGFRRSGFMFYQNCCPGCNECIPVRTEVDSFAMSASQKRIWKKNQDIVTEVRPLFFDEECFQLYRKFSVERFQTDVDEAGYRDFLLKSPVESRMMTYRLENELIGVGWLDILQDVVSSVYFAFDPDYAKRSLGTFSIMKEIQLAQELGKTHLYLGFYVKECQAMSYKIKFSPSSVLNGNEWQPA